MKFILGANYWSSAWGTEMWRHYDGRQIRGDLKKLAEYGVKNLRIFPNWRDFQPVDKAYAWTGRHGEYINANTGEPVYGDGVDMTMIENFRDFCHAAEENGIELVVAIVTGWMSGRLYYPPVLANKNLITDPEALMWMRRFIKRFVCELKNEKSIIMWGLGNESNCMGNVSTRYEAYNWTAAVVDTIRSEDITRPISSDMHGLKSGTDDEGCWLLEDQGELTDMLCTHPYPSPTVGGDVEPYNRLRMTCLPTAQTLYYADVSQKPAYIQESGTFSQMIGNYDMDAQFMRIQILSAVANNLKGYQWWCAWEQKHLKFPPYTWVMIERELGMFDVNQNPKPVAFEMKKMRQLIERLPEEFPQRAIDGVCVLSRNQDKQKIAVSTVLLGKQAGVDLGIIYTESSNIPQANLYFLPCITGWQVLYKKTYDTLLERVKNGATLYISFDGGQITDFPEIVGARSNGFINNQSHSVQIEDKTILYTCKEILLDITTAEVLYRNEAGNPVMLKNKYGKGKVYFANFPVERLAFDGADFYNKVPYYKFYKEMAKEIIADKPIMVENQNIGVTINPINDSECFATLLNYSDENINIDLKIKDGWEIIEIVYGDVKKIPACDGVFLKLYKK